MDSASLTAQYEALRARMVGDPVVRQPAHGLAVLVRSGMVAWLAQMQRSPSECDEKPAMQPREAQPSPVRSPSCDGMTATTILILASMVLSARLEQSNDDLS